MTTLLAGDIGGTKTLLGLYSLEGTALIQRASQRYVSADWPDFSALVNHFLEGQAQTFARPQQACFAIAGPVRQGRVKLTNLPWLLEEERLARDCQLKAVELVNDFAVLIYGLPHLQPEQQTTLRDPSGGQPDPKAPIAILGAGTGLGVAVGIPTASGLQAMASEASHGEFAPCNEKQWQLKRWLMAELNLPRLSIERIVSGTGLGDVMRWHLATHPDGRNHALMGTADTELPAATAAAAGGGDPLARAALDLWLEAYGSCAGDLALQSLCYGGLWVGGGTAGKLLDELRSERFLRPFLNKGRLSPVVEQIPVHALVDGETGLFSAACRARHLNA
ncbi:glucokinase [Synechococcus sp. A10-1-5-1]|uniref:glucokinase n=1 Tax=Synechococcus sp. A10-1-5-1 TaxID=2936507 RepID=UPI0020019D8E|nr:glucokinase [Synechococcus sp. A10-1-5-1]UPM50375.1 glucokinase [Synechococcus sp. A10-1-5-1]